MRRILMSALLLAAAILLQLTWVNGLRLPGGGVPDLVLVVVASLGLASGPVPGAVVGFAAGVCLDLAPPASGVLGEYALVFVIVGYACGRLRPTLARSAVLPIIIVAAACAAGELMVAGLGLALQSGQVSLASIRQLLPAAVSYDVAISPFVLYAVLLAGAWLAEATGDRIAVSAGSRPPASGAAREIPAGALVGSGSLASGAASGVVLLGVGGWLAGPPHSRRARRAAARRTPRLRPGAGHPGDGWIGSSAAVRGGPGGNRRPGGAVPHGFSGSGRGGSALRGPGLPPSALTGEALRGQAFRGRAGGPGKAPGGARLRSGVAGSAAPGHLPRALPPAPVRLRLGGRGRRGPVEVSRLLSGGALGRVGRRRPRRAGGFRPGGQPGGSALPRPGAPRQAGGPAAPRLRIAFRNHGGGHGHGRDGIVGGGALTRSIGGAPRPAAPRFRIHSGPAAGRKASRPATPRFRARPLAGAGPLPGKRPRFGHRRWGVLHLLRRRRGSRSQVWRINSRWQNGGLE